MKNKSFCRFAILNKEDGYALPFILLTILLITSLVLSLISVLYFSNIIERKKALKTRLELACGSAIQKHLTTSEIPGEGKEIIVVDSINVFVSYRFNGLFYEVSAASRFGKDSAIVISTYACKPDSVFDNAVIISSNTDNAVFAGMTKITGNIFATTNRFSGGNIFGIRNNPDKYLDGDIIKTNYVKEKLFTDSLVVKQLRKLQSVNQSKIYNGDLYIDANSLDSINGFAISGNLIIKGESGYSKRKNEIVVFVNGAVAFEEKTKIENKMTIYCDSTIDIRANSNLSNAVLVSRAGINVHHDNKLKNVQLLTAKNIFINNSVFEFPSIICSYVNPSDEWALNNKIKIEGSLINGTVMLLSGAVGLSQNKSKIEIDSKSRIQGVVYSENNSDISGSVIGSVYTYKFQHYKEPTEYVNWLIDLKVNRKELSKWFLLPVGFTNKYSFTLLNEIWIY